MIKGTNIGFSIEKTILLKDINFEIPKEKITAFVGPSGAGKTTLLKCIVNLYNDNTGKIFADGIDVQSISSRERAKLIGYVFQQYNLFNHMTVIQNCAYPLSRLHGISVGQAKKQAMEILEHLGIHMLADKKPTQLSGGQQQRIAIARALCLKPSVLLLDEPSSALDPETTHNLASLLKNLCAHGATIALSSHDISLVNDVADQIYRIDQGRMQIISNLTKF